MELLCSWCGVSLTTTPWGTTYDPCGHNICYGCYLFYHWSRVCVVCTFKNPATKGGIPETHSRTPQPRPPLLPAPPPSALPHPTPDLTAPSWNTTRTNTTHPSTSQNHTTETGFSSSPHKEDSRQSSLRQTGDPRRLNDSQKSEEDPRAAQGSIQTLSQQEPSSRSKDPHQPDSVIGIHSSAQLDKEQKTPHIRKTKNRGSPPYPSKSPKDEYLDSSRETLPSPPRSRNASPSPCSTNDRGRISSSPQWPAQRSRSCPRTRETERSSSSHTSPRDPSPSPSRPTNLPPSPSSAGKSSPAPTTPKESFTFNSAGKDVKFTGKAIRGGSVEGAAPPSRTPTPQPHIKPALIPTVAKVVNDDLPQHHQTSRDLGDGLNHKTQGMEMKERGSVGLKHEDNRQQSESFAHEEKDRKRQEDYVQLREPNVGQQNESQVEELTVSGGQIKTLTRENVELKGEVTALREAKDTAEKEAMYWKKENAKQQEAAQQEMDHFRKEQVQRLQEHYDNWEGRMKEMQVQITSQEQEKKQLREKSNRLENDLHQVIEDLARCKEYAMQLERENAHQHELTSIFTLSSLYCPNPLRMS